MYLIDDSPLERLTLVTPQIALSVTSIVDHPGSWLEILKILPCRAKDGTCLDIESSSGQIINVRTEKIAEPAFDEVRLHGHRHFGLWFTTSGSEYRAALEFKVTASATELETELSLVSAESTLLENPALARALWMTMSNLLKTAYCDVIANFRAALSPDLASTKVALVLTMPNSTFTELLKDAVEDLTSDLLDIATPPLASPPTCRGWLANARVAKVQRRVEVAEKIEPPVLAALPERMHAQVPPANACDIEAEVVTLVESPEVAVTVAEPLMAAPATEASVAAEVEAAVPGASAKSSRPPRVRHSAGIGGADARPEATPSPHVDSVKTELSPEQRTALATNLVALRVARGMGQLAVASKALGQDKSHAAVSRLERGLLSVTETDRLVKLAAFFNTDVPSLLRPGRAV